MAWRKYSMQACNLRMAKAKMRLPMWAFPRGDSSRMDKKRISERPQNT